MIDPFRRGRLLAVLLSFTAAMVSAQVPQPAPGPRVLPAPPGLLQQFDVMAGTLQELEVPPAPVGNVAVAIVLRGRLRQLLLHEHDVRSPGFQLIEVGANGPHVLPTPPSVTWRGVLADEPDSVVAATIVAGGMRALIRTANQETWAVQPVREVLPTAGASVHVVFFGGDSANLVRTCATAGALSAPVPWVAPDEVVYQCQFIPEADPAFWQLNGSSTTNTQNDITAVVNAMDVIYRADVQISFTVPQIIVNTGADFYSSSVAQNLLPQFASYWSANRGGTVRDLAHLFTGRPMGQSSGGAIGIAYLGGVCSYQIGYGVSQSRFTNNMTLRTAVTAHEVGHNFNAQHCDAVPPCYIMCSGVGGCANVQTTFSQNERNQIIGFRQQVGCLTQISTAPAISSAAPTTVKVFYPQQVTLNGTGFTGVNQVQIDGVAVPAPAIQVVSDTQMRFSPTNGLTPGFHLMRVVNPSGPSNQWPLAFVGTQPCEIRVPSGILGGSTLTWEMGGAPADAAYLVVSLTNTTAPLQGWPVLSGLSPLWLGTLDSRGLASYSIQVPPQVLNGVRVYSQMLGFDPATLALRSSSNLGNTIVIF